MAVGPRGHRSRRARLREPDRGLRDLGLRQRGCASPAARRRAGSGRASRSPSAGRRRPGPRAAPARRRSSSRRSRASPSRPAKRRLPMLLPIETWSAACCWVSDCTSCSIVRLDSASRCSTQVSGSASASPWPCRRRASSATNGLTIGGFERAMSATTQDQALGIAFGDLHHLVRPALRPALACMRAAVIARAHAAQVLDQRQPQHDRDRPQLAQRERRDGLVGGRRSAQGVRESTRPSPCEIASSAMS